MMIKIRRGVHHHYLLLLQKRRTRIRRNHHLCAAASFSFSSSSSSSSSPLSENSIINNNNNNQSCQRQRLQSVQSRPKAVVRSALQLLTTNKHDDHDGTTTTIEYTRGWAWQQLLLHRKLQHKRRQRISRSSSASASSASSTTNNSDNNINNDIDTSNDIILLFEHEPVYTLGRGSDENHFTFLNDKNDPNYSDLDRHKLARTSRGPNSARLGIKDSDMRTLMVLENDCTDNHNTNDISIINNLCRTSSVSPVIAPNDAKIYRVERGGEVTYHGPGQLVVYPIFDLEQQEYYQKDLHWYLRTVEEVIIRTLRDEYGIENAVRDEINTGVWVNERKIAAVGVSASRWITTHGFAINVSPDLSYFDTSIITPCGIEGRGVTSIANEMVQQQETIEVPSVQHVSETVIQKFQEVFDIDIEKGPALR